MGLPIGRIADRWNRRNLIVAGILIWSFFTTMSSVAKSFLLLFLTRIGVGVGEASLSPAGYSMMSDYFPKQKLGAAISVFYMGVFIGSSLAMLVGGTTVDMLARTPFITVPVLGTMASWRLTFVIVGLPGVLFALLACDHSRTGSPQSAGVGRRAGHATQLRRGHGADPHAVAIRGRHLAGHGVPGDDHLWAARLGPHVLPASTSLVSGPIRTRSGRDPADVRMPAGCMSADE